MKIIETVEDLKAVVKEFTAKARAEAPVIEAPKEPTHPLAIRLSKAFSRSDFGCQKPHVKEILTAIMVEGLGIPAEEAVIQESEKVKLPPISIGFLYMMVPLVNNNGHSYELGEPCLAISRGHPYSGLLQKDGDTGNSLSDNNSRLATDEEIDSFFEGYGGKDEADPETSNLFTRSIDSLLKG